MIPFPGESLSLWAAADGGGSGADLAPFIGLRAGSATLAAGDDWRVSVTSGWADYLEDGSTPVTVSWVVEVLSGSVTVAASEGPSTPLTGATPTSLGTHTLAAGTNVIASTFTVDDVLSAPDDMLLRLAASSGSAVVQQVKMRVWPTAGVAGGWSDPYPAWTQQAQADVSEPSEQRYLSHGEGGPPGTADALWESVKGVIQAQQDDPFTGTLTTTGTIVAGQLVTSTYVFDGELIDSEVEWLLTLPFVRARRPAGVLPNVDPSLPLVDGVDYIRPPEEVFGDDAYNLQALGSVGVSWDTSTAHLQTIHDADGGGQIFVAALPDDSTDDTVTFTWPDSAATATGGVLDLPDSDSLIFAATHTLMRDDVPSSYGAVTDNWRFVVGNGAYTWAVENPEFVGLSYLLAFPAYRLWNPAAVVERVSVLRHGTRNDGHTSTAPRRWGQESSYQSGRNGGYV